MKFKFLAIPLLLISLASCGGGKIEELPHEHGSTLTVYGFNDVHGTIETDSENIGLDKVSTIIKNAEGYNPEMTMLLSAGDMFQGSGISNLTNGESMIDVMNAMKFDVMTIGNHEFDWTVDVLKENIKKAKFPIVSYDIYQKKNDKLADFVEPYTVVIKGGYRIGVIGEIGKIETSIAAKMIEDYYFDPDVDKINSYAKTLKNKQGCDAVFLLTHSGPSSSYRKLDNEYVDAIFGGHTHNVVSNQKYNDIPYFQNGEKNEALTKYTIDFETGVVESSVTTYTKVQREETAVDPVVQAVIDKHKLTTDPILNEVVGQLVGKFDSLDLGKLVTKVMYNYAVSKGISSTNLLAIHNQRGVRVDSLGVEGETTDITYGMIYEAYPFDNDVRLVTHKGDVLRSSGTGNYVYGTQSTALLDANTTYNVISISYLTESGNLSNEGGGECLSDTVVYCRDLVSDFFKASGTVTTASIQ